MTNDINEKVREKVVLDLKRKALACKQADQKVEALVFLKQAKEFEAITTIESIQENEMKCTYLKSLAVHLKTEGDIHGALEALRQAKQVEKIQEEEELEMQEDRTNNNPSTSIAFTDEEMMDEDMMMEFQLNGMDVPSQKMYQRKIMEYKQKALASKKAGDKTEALAFLKQAKIFQKVMESLTSNNNDGLATDTTATDDDTWMNSLTEEERELMGELMDNSSTAESFDDLFADEGKQQNIEWYDLETMDDSDIREFLDMGIVTIPSVEDLIKESAVKQNEAIQFKQNGNIEMAKTRLVESKKIKGIAERLERIYKDEIDPSNTNDEQDLEKLFLQNEGIVKEEKQEEENPWSLKPAKDIKLEILRLKGEKKVTEANQLLKIYKIVLQNEAEEAEREKREEIYSKIQSQIHMCHWQIQLYTFFRHGTTDEVLKSMASQQLLLWQKYCTECKNAILAVEKKGSKSIVIRNTTSQLETMAEGDVCSLIERQTLSGSLKGLLEVTVLEVFGIHENRSVQKLIKKKKKDQSDATQVSFQKLKNHLQVQVKIPLPPGAIVSTSGKSEEATSLPSSIFSFLPAVEVVNTDSSDQGSVIFPENSSRYVALPRGDEEKTILRRLERKRIDVQLYYNPNVSQKETKKSSWFWKSAETSGQNDNESNDASLLGKVVLEMKDLFYRNNIAGDFSLVMNSKPVGGTIRLCLRTDSPLDSSRFEGNAPVQTVGHNGTNKSSITQPYHDQLMFSSVSSKES